jgi:hypothetical protein
MKRLRQYIGGPEFVEYFVEHDPTKFRVLPEEPRIPLSVYVGVAGMAGRNCDVLVEGKSCPQHAHIFPISS